MGGTTKSPLGLEEAGRRRAAPEPASSGQSPRPRQPQRRRGRRANGEGTITHRSDGRWQAAVYKPDGTRKFLYASTRDEVHDKLVIAQRALMDGLPLPDERITVGDYLDQWLETLKTLGSVRPTTWQSYDSLARIHLKPGIGKARLAKLQPAHVQQFMAAQLADGATPRTIRYSRVVLRAALGQAMKLGLVTRNAAALTTPPKVSGKRIARPLTPDEARNLVDGLDGDPLKALHILMLSLGLRQGEALGLRWTDVDLDHSVLHVRVQLQRIDHEYRLDELKTERSQRDLPLSQYQIRLLQEHRARQNEECLKSAKWGNNWDLVFTAPGGRPLNSPTVDRLFQKSLERIGIAKRRHYDLRHTTASLLIDQGAELRDVMEQLGHSQIALTANTYGHIFLDRKRKLAATMGQFLSSNTARSAE
jgi:integrase